MFSVVHGGLDPRLVEVCNFLKDLDFDGFGIGGSLGRSVSDCKSVLNTIMPVLPPDKPKHLLGLADTGMILMGSQLGIDSFDSCFPTKLARHGTAFGSNLPFNSNEDSPSDLIDNFNALKSNNRPLNERIYLRSAKHLSDYGPIDPHCNCSTCQKYSRSYITHLLKQNEVVGLQLISIHNIHHTTQLMANIRKLILFDQL